MRIVLKKEYEIEVSDDSELYEKDGQQFLKIGWKHFSLNSLEHTLLEYTHNRADYKNLKKEQYIEIVNITGLMAEIKNS